MVCSASACNLWERWMMIGTKNGECFLVRWRSAARGSLSFFIRSWLVGWIFNTDLWSSETNGVSHIFVRLQEASSTFYPRGMNSFCTTFFFIQNSSQMDFFFSKDNVDLKKRYVFSFAFELIDLAAGRGKFENHCGSSESLEYLPTRKMERERKGTREEEQKRARPRLCWWIKYSLSRHCGSRFFAS